MALLTTAFAVILTFSLVSARNCRNFTLAIQISARNGIFSVAAPQNAIDVTNLALDFARQGRNYSRTVLQGYGTVAGIYNIAATHCTPDGGEGSVLQILTHGIGFDRSYWDLAFNDYNYSYVATAVDNYGYSTLSWDRVGIGMSSHGDPVAEIQAPLEQAALVALTEFARSRTTASPSYRFSKVVHVGHSFGSVLSYGMACAHPSLSDGLVLTGFAQNSTFFPFYDYGANLESVTTLTSQYEEGYLASANQAALQINFFGPGQFDPNMLPFAYLTAQPAAIGELLTIEGTMYPNSPFTGPVAVITGERDLPFCGGDCFATGDPNVASIPATVRNSFPDANNVQVIIVPSAGHALNLEYSHQTVYQHIDGFLTSSGLS